MKNLLTDNKDRLNLGKVYFCYLFLALFLQIIGVGAKGSLLDTLWKIAVICCVLVYVFIYSKGKIWATVIVPCLIYALGQILAWAFIPSELMGKVNIFSSFANVAVVIAMIYLLLSVPYTCKTFEKKDAITFCKAFLWLMLYAVIYNFIVNPEAVLGFMNKKTVYSDMITSFFDNKQTFGMFLLMAVICSVLLYVLEDKSKYLLFAAFFGVNLFICLSRTALLACVVFVAALLVLMYKPNKKLFNILMTVCMVTVGIFLVVSPLRNFLVDVVFNTEETVNARTDIWAAAFEELKEFRWLIGYGESNTSVILLETGVSLYSHNGIIQVLLTGGIVKLILYILVLIKCVSSYSYIKRHNAALANTFIASMISIFVYSMGEAIVLLDTSMPCVVATIVTVALPFCFERMYRREAKLLEGNMKDGKD